MENRAYIIRVDGITEDLDHRPTLEEAQSIVGGYVELVPIRGTNKTIVVNEEGKPRNLPLNKIATAHFYDFVRTDIVGDVIVLEGWKTVGG